MRLHTLSRLVVLGCVLLSVTAGTAPATPAAKPLSVRRVAASAAGRTTLAVVALSAASAPSFARPREYTLCQDPPCGGITFTSIAIGDLNGDRKPDLATADIGGYTVSVFLNRSDGSFGAGGHSYGTDDPAFSVAIGDLNGDGQPDLATANYGGTVSVFLNKGDGSFQTRRSYATGRSPFSVAIDDLNGDRKPDLVTANSGGSTVSVFLNKGDGSFRAKHDYRTGKNPHSVAIGDLNGDGKPDLATANSGTDDNPGKTVSVFLNKGDGSFRAKHDYRTGREPFSVAIGDLNGDGKPDLATANIGADTVSVLLNRGEGGFQAKRDHATGGRPRSVSLGDLNGDGKPDLATADAAANTVSVLLNKDDGSFGARLDYGTGDGPLSVALGDLDGDGKPDLVTANEGTEENPEGTVSVLLATTTGVCVVPNVRAETLPAAKRAIGRANCRVGKIRRAYSKIVSKGRVISETPAPRRVLPLRGKVNLVVSRGRKQ